jgi:putative transposase
MTGWSLTIAMKKSKFTEAQIVFALQQAESGVTVAEVCRKLVISEATFYSWKKKYKRVGPVLSGLTPNEVVQQHSKWSNFFYFRLKATSGFRSNCRESLTN